MGITFSAHNLQFNWNKQRTVFSNVSFTLKPGELFCILGPNGTGKSTLLRCLINLLDLNNGSVQIENIDIREMERQELAKKIAFVPQRWDVSFPYTVIDYVVMGRAPFISAFSSPKDEDIKIAIDAIQEVGVFHLIDKPVNEISGGEHQLALIARALAQEPEILLLDEPTSHLDFGNQMQVLSLIERLRDRGISIIMTSHFPDHAFIVSDMVGIMREGSFSKIGPAEEVITSEDLKATYHVDVRVEFIEVAGRKVCIPVRYRTGCECSTESILDQYFKECQEHAGLCKNCGFC
ncbi:ABC transporter ATP-binding protein [Methanospirillum lacunae]|uniref:Cobalamin import ATP-binding protein BtuD n=1 Tax=Methanospirillum lacunae TaxID=668570 RepID=A0A2V2MTA7_9EURY|nr:ABC transporter ATP-binding protein [Methanospirillum lacunae]PWR71262.1 iron ABC transporter ATP-binding protein [Methanospirillum lacunae]